jgi:hypothetical protein
MTRVTISFGPVSHPQREPGATIFENESRRSTRPSVSSERNDGVMGASAPWGRIWRKQSGMSNR